MKANMCAVKLVKLVRNRGVEWLILRARKKYQARKRRQRRVRAKLHGTAERPRLNIFRSNENIFAQVINDDAGHTLSIIFNH